MHSNVSYTMWAGLMKQNHSCWSAYRNRICYLNTSLCNHNTPLIGPDWCPQTPSNRTHKSPYRNRVTTGISLWNQAGSQTSAYGTWWGLQASVYRARRAPKHFPTKTWQVAKRLPTGSDT